MVVGVSVLLVDRDGKPGADNINNSPCIRVTVIGPKQRLALVGLLDTGETAVYLDKGLIEALDLTRIEPMAYAATVNIPTTEAGNGVTFPIEIQSRDFGECRRQYQLILGRAFLTLFDFGYSLRRQAWTLGYPGN